MNEQEIQNLRQDYRMSGLSRDDINLDPIEQFKEWFETAVSTGMIDPNAMNLATVNKDGRPVARTVLLKGVDQRGFVFYTNYDSRKGEEIKANPYGALTFWWPNLERQIRIEGTVEKVSSEESDSYYHSRPRGSQLGAWASPQSQEIDNRETLQKEQTRIEEKYSDVDPIPRPDFWGGYRVVPDRIEFWQGRQNRLHDRLAYTKINESEWEIKRLAP